MKKSCAWRRGASSCDLNQRRETSHDINSICGGGTSSVCFDQIPFQVDGCPDMSFAFVASSGHYAGVSSCGKCFQITLTGEGQWKTTPQTQALKGKKLIVMSNTIDYDVKADQFGVMVPGGGVGLYNGCGKYFGDSNIGSQYGGILSECIEVKKASDPVSCLKQGCQKAFARIPLADKCMHGGHKFESCVVHGAIRTIGAAGSASA